MIPSQIAQADDVYRALARRLDRLPGGFPPSESGVELRILHRLFTPQEARLAIHLELIAEEARVIAKRAGVQTEEAASHLESMYQKGLVYCNRPPGKPPRYMVEQFVIGFYESQVNRLDRDFARDIEEYASRVITPEQWKKAPRLRTIPVGESIPVDLKVMPYESAAGVLAANNVFAIANCICRQQKRLLDKGCSKPLETCLTFGVAAEHYIQSGRGRSINRQEAAEILSKAEEAGLVLQPSNDRNPLNICTCCGCCCGVPQNLKRHPQPGTLVSSPFRATLNGNLCTGCGTCEQRCPMDAIQLVEGQAVLDSGRCIGCGLCVSTCPSGALSMSRKPTHEQSPVPANVVRTYLRNGWALGKLGLPELVSMVLRSFVDRIRTPR